MKICFEEFIVNKIEAFCSKDYELVCIDCILSNIHKNHKLISLDKAVEKENQALIQNQKEISKYKQMLTLQHKEYMNICGSNFDQINGEISKVFNNIREIINKREHEVKKIFKSSHEQLKCIQNKNIDKLNFQLSQIQSFENIKYLRTKENQKDIVRFLKECKNRLEQYNNAKAHIELDELSPTFVLNTHDEIDTVCKLISSELSIESNPSNYENSQNKCTTHPRKTFYNRPMPKSSNNQTKSSIPRFQNKSEINYRSISSREIKNVSSNKYIVTKHSTREMDEKYVYSEFPRKNSACSHISKKSSNAPMMVSPNTKNPDYDYKRSIIKTLENKQCSNILGDEGNLIFFQRHQVLNKHNFVYSGNKKNDFSQKREACQRSNNHWKEGTIKVKNDIIAFNIDLDEAQTPKIESQDCQTKSPMPDMEGIKIGSISQASNRATKNFLSQSIDRTKSMSSLRFQNISCNLMEKRNDRKKEKQDSQVRLNKSEAAEFNQHIGDLEKIISINMRKGSNCASNSIRRNIMLNSTSHFKGLACSLENDYIHNYSLGNTSRDLKNSSRNNENSRFELCDEDQIIYETEMSELKSTDSIVDLRELK